MKLTNNSTLLLSYFIKNDCIKESKHSEKTQKILKKIPHTKIAAIEARGFIFASALAYANKKPLILLRKKNKLPAATISQSFKLEYGIDTIQVHKSSLNKKDCGLYSSAESITA